MKDEKQKLQILTLAFALAAALEPWSATGRDSGTGCNVNKGEKLDKCVYSDLRCMCYCKYKKYKYNGENDTCVYSEVSKIGHVHRQKNSEKYFPPPSTPRTA